MSARLKSPVDDFVSQAAAWEAGGARGIFIPGTKTNDTFIHEDEAIAFPPVKAGIAPLGARILVQYMMPIIRSQSGLLVSDETRAIDHDRMQVAKVLALGPLAFHNRQTNELWPEGAWCKVGDYIRAPIYPKDVVLRAVTMRDRTFDEASGKHIEHARDDRARLALINDLDVVAIYDSVEAAMAERPQS